jgi:hypothetical protein
MKLYWNMFRNNTAECIKIAKGSYVQSIVMLFLLTTDIHLNIFLTSLKIHIWRPERRKEDNIKLGQS